MPGCYRTAYLPVEVKQAQTKSRRPEDTPQAHAINTANENPKRNGVCKYHNFMARNVWSYTTFIFSSVEA